MSLRPTNHKRLIIFDHRPNKSEPYQRPDITSCRFSFETIMRTGLVTSNFHPSFRFACLSSTINKEIQNNMSNWATRTSDSSYNQISPASRHQALIGFPLLTLRQDSTPDGITVLPHQRGGLLCARTVLCLLRRLLLHILLPL